MYAGNVKYGTILVWLNAFGVEYFMLNISCCKVMLRILRFENCSFNATRVWMGKLF